MVSKIPEAQSATELARRLHDGETTAVEIAGQHLDRIRKHADPSIFITLTQERAFREAEASDQRRQMGKTKGPWDGIPVVWKDLFDTQGDPTTAGARVYQNAPPAHQDASVVAACRDAGMVCLGKSNLSEFAYSGLGLNPHFGTPVNPRSDATPRAPGGSSSGSAVAVAAGLAPIAVGTDTAGSVRVPASFCGIPGFKSSQNRYANDGIFPLSSSLDSVGSFAQTVDELIALDAIMRVKPVMPSAQANLNEPEFIVPQTLVFDDVAPAILKQFEAFTERLSNAGFKVSRVSFPIFGEVTLLFRRHGTLTVAEAATLHSALLMSDQAALMDQRVRTRILTASGFSAQDYIKLQWERARLQQETGVQLGGKFLLFPTVAVTAPKLCDLEADDEHFAEVNLKVLRNTMLGNYLGTPGVTLPIGADEDGLPIGALISAAFGQDDRVLAAAKTIEFCADHGPR